MSVPPADPADPDDRESVARVLAAQRAVCARARAELEHAMPDRKVGISRELLEHPERRPVYGIRHRPLPSTTGWYLWCGDKTDDPDFFVPVHLGHLWRTHAELLPYLGLARGWGFVLAPGYEDIWYDPEYAAVDG